MSSRKPVNDGGPAFPVLGEYNGEWFACSGMSLRDYAEVRFTAAWITALGADVFWDASGRATPDIPADFVEQVQRLGALQADAMIAARTNPEPSP